LSNITFELKQPWYHQLDKQYNTFMLNANSFESKQGRWRSFLDLFCL